MKLTNKKIKKLALGSLLVASLTGCGKELNIEDVQDWAKENGYEISKESEVNTNEVEETTVTVSDSRIDELAEQSYNKYRDFYDYKEYDLEEVKTMVKVLNGQLDGLTKIELDSALSAIYDCLFDMNTSQLLVNTNTIMNHSDDEIESLDLPESMKVYMTPSISSLIINGDTESLDNIAKYESLRDDLIREVATTGRYSEDTVAKINAALIEQETKEYHSFNGDIESEICDYGIKYALVCSKMDLVNLAVKVNPTSAFVEAENGIKFQIAPRGDMNEEGYIETDILAKYLQKTMEGKEDKELEDLATEIELRLVGTKYNNEICSLQATMNSYVSNDTSMNKIGELKLASEKLKQYKASLTEVCENDIPTYVFKC